MKSYHYECIYKKDYVQGKIKAASFDSAMIKVKQKFHDEQIKCLRVYKIESPLKKLFGNVLFDLRTILTRIIPIALGIIILYLLYYRFA